MANATHADQDPNDGVHIPYAWTFADAAARAAGTVTDGPTIVAAHIGRLGRQLDDNSLWMLTGFGPLVWLAASFDSNAIHDNVPSEISAVASKATLAAGDFLLIEDSAASNAKKRAIMSAIAAFVLGPDLRVIGKTLCGRLTNNSGATIVAGSVLMVDSGNDNSALKCTNVLEEKNIGICAEDSDDTEDIWIVGLHVFSVTCSTGPIVRGGYLDPASTAGLAHDHAAPEPGVFAVALTGKGTGLGSVQACYTRAEVF